jgi:hypothetical protein
LLLPERPHSGGLSSFGDVCPRRLSAYNAEDQGNGNTGGGSAGYNGTLRNW